MQPSSNFVRPPFVQRLAVFPRGQAVGPMLPPTQFRHPAQPSQQSSRRLSYVKLRVPQIKPAKSIPKAPSTSKVINTHIQDLVEVPTKKSRKWRKIIGALLIGATVLAAALVPSLVLNYGLTTTTTTTTTSTTSTTTTSTTSTTSTTTTTTTTSTSTTSTTTTTTTTSTSTTSTTTTTSTTSTSTTSTTTTTTTTFACIPSCVNGNCTGPNTCRCITGWYGSTCALANCTNPCQNGGTCSSPNTCTCANGWIGTTCTTPVCSPTCQNGGTCIAPNVCNCTTSWTGSSCQTPVCNPACTNGGNCTAPNNCTCNTNMWTGPICQTPNRIFWSFDNTLQDLYNNFDGIGENSPGYSSPGYNGAGACLSLTRSMSQSVTILSPPFLNMAYTSFTLEAWMYANTLCNGTGCTDDALFGQFQQNILDHSLHIIVRNQSIYLGFFADDTRGNRTIYPGQWYHMAYVYDYPSTTQFVYVNGYLDVSRSPAGPYQGTTGNLTIGTNGVNYPNNYFDGYLDSIAYFGRSKNATEILDDATLVTFLSFDNNNLLDSGPLGINGTGTSYSFTSSGRVSNALILSNTWSYVQVTGLRRIGTNSWPYSVAIWIKPTSLAGGTIMHLSSRVDGAQPNAWCLAIMGLTSSGRIAIDSWNGSNVPLTGPSVPANVWTHVVGTYSPTNGERLYVNGTLQASSGAYNFAAGSSLMTITLGSSLNGTGVCNTGTTQAGQFYGSLDQFYVYARELTASEVSALYNV